MLLHSHLKVSQLYIMSVLWCYVPRLSEGDEVVLRSQFVMMTFFLTSHKLDTFSSFLDKHVILLEVRRYLLSSCDVLL